MATYEDLQGSLLDGRYRVEGRLGSGGFGEVVAASQESLGLAWRKVALKLFTKDYVNRDNANRVFREALLLEKLAQEARNEGRETHLVTVHDVGLLRDYHHTPFVAMEMVDGGSLRDRLRGGRALPLSEVIRLTRDVCAGLLPAHGASIVHRDLKPENVLITRGGVLKVADFGLAIDRYEAFLQTGQAGTVGYSPPESREGIPASPAFDVYSLGVIMLELLLGNNPLTHVAQRAAEAGRSLDGDLTRGQEALARLENPETGQDLTACLIELREKRDFREVLTACLAPGPGARFSDAGALDTALASCQSDEPPRLPAVDPDAGRHLLRSAHRQLSRGELDAAAASFDKARLHFPREPQIHFGLSQVCERQGRLDESIDQQERGLRLRRTVPELERLADLYKRSGNASKAQSILLLAKTLGRRR